MFRLVVFPFAKERNFASFATPSERLNRLIDFYETWHTRLDAVRLQKPNI